MKEKLLEKLKSAIKNPLRLSIKMFCLVWFFLIVQVILKLTFNYWQPYVIPTVQLENLGNFIDDHRWLQATLNGVFYLFNSILMTLCSLQQWKFKDNKQRFIFYIACVLCFILNAVLKLKTLSSILISIVVPLILNYKKWKTIIITFVLNFVFLFLSLFLEGFVTADNMNYLVRTFLQFDYYIMLVLSYILFNIIRIKKEG